MIPLLHSLLLHLKREAHNCDGKCLEGMGVNFSVLFFFVVCFLCICLFKEPVHCVIMSWHVFIFVDIGNVYIVSYVIHTLHLERVVANVKMLLLRLFFLKGSPDTIHTVTEPFPLTKCILIHYVYFTRFYFVNAPSPMNLLVNSPHDSWGCSQMCEL